MMRHDNVAEGLIDVHCRLCGRLDEEPLRAPHERRVFCRRRHLGEYPYEERASESHTLVARGRERRKGDELIGIVAKLLKVPFLPMKVVFVSVDVLLCVSSLFSPQISSFILSK
jgi:hypothetical protein